MVYMVFWNERRFQTKQELSVTRRQTHIRHIDYTRLSCLNNLQSVPQPQNTVQAPYHQDVPPLTCHAASTSHCSCLAPSGAATLTSVEICLVHHCILHVGHTAWHLRSALEIFVRWGNE